MRLSIAFFAAMTLTACDADSTDADAPTWHADVHPLVKANCSGCHTEGGAAWSMDEYAATSALATHMVLEIDAGRMPPWQAEETDECQPTNAYVDDMRLTDDEKQILRDWAAAGAPLGDPETAAELPDTPSLELPRVDITLTPDMGWTTSGEFDQFRCFSFDPGHVGDMWIEGMQVVPGQDEVVHHVVMFIDEDAESADWGATEGSYDCFGGPGLTGRTGLDQIGGVLGAWAPGGVPLVTPDDTALKVPAGSRIIVQVHYHPSGHELYDETALQIMLADEAPEWEGKIVLLGNFEDRIPDRGGLMPGPNDPEDGVEFRIPAGATDHTETLAFKLYPSDLGAEEIRVYGAGTHMHYVGTGMRWWVEHETPIGDEPKDECMVHTPQWDFNWQRGYGFDVPLAQAPEIRPGDTIWMECVYDNSLGNPAVVDALAEQGLEEPVDVYLGEETLDEMCLAAMGLALR
jgi:hypothetical protein